MKTKKWYVTMTDKFMSGWGKAQGTLNKLIFICDSYDEAVIVSDNAKNRSDQKNVNICSTKPRFPSHYYVQFKDKEEYPSWYKEGYFKK